MEDRGTPSKEGEIDITLPTAVEAPLESSLLIPPLTPHNDLPKSSQSQDNTPKSGVSGPTKPANTSEDANNELARLKRDGKITLGDIENTTSVLKEHASLKEKVDKLKSLLGRSAKAQRETKVEFETTQKRLNQALREIERLNQKLDKLQSRPTHCKFCCCCLRWDYMSFGNISIM